ncbi:unnamed protein product, partial [marine sediment metagenome]
MIYINGRAKPKLSDLNIDTSKDWAAKKIENLCAPEANNDAARRDTIDSKITTHKDDASAHHDKYTNAEAQAQAAALIAIHAALATVHQDAPAIAAAEVAAHTTPAAHHTKTIDASELTAGILALARLAGIT